MKALLDKYGPHITMGIIAIIAVINVMNGGSPE